MIWLLLAVALAIASGKRETMQAAPKGKPVETARALGLEGDWLLWIRWVAQGESRQRINAHNDSPGESAAAGKAYDRLVAEGRWPCAKDRKRYAIGSGGWFGQLAPLTIFYGAKLGYGCDPIAIWRDPIACVRTHLAQVRPTLASLRRRTSGHGTWMELRALYGLPSRDPDDPTDPSDSHNIDTPERRAQYSGTLRRLGIDPSFLDREVPPLPGGV